MAKNEIDSKDINILPRLTWIFISFMILLLGSFPFLFTFTILIVDKSEIGKYSELLNITILMWSYGFVLVLTGTYFLVYNFWHLIDELNRAKDKSFFSLLKMKRIPQSEEKMIRANEINCRIYEEEGKRTSVELFAQAKEDYRISYKALKKRKEFVPTNNELYALSITNIGKLLWEYCNVIDENSTINLEKTGSVINWEIRMKNNAIDILLTSYPVYIWRSPPPEQPLYHRILKIKINTSKKGIAELIHILTTKVEPPPYEVYDLKQLKKKFNMSKDQVINSWKKWVHLYK